MTGPENRSRVLVVASGKGGVGKTNLAVNLAVALRLFGVKALLLDADTGLGNVDVLLGLNARHNLRDVVLGGWPLERVVVNGPCGLKILPGASGVEEMAQLSAPQFDAFLRQLESYCAGMDIVIVDTASGISSTVVRCLLAADEALLVTNPEPAALTDAYALLKVLSRRSPRSPRTVSVIMNRITSKEEAIQSFDRLRLAAKRFLGREVEYLGSVVHDDTVTEAAKRQVDFMTYYSGAPCSRDVKKLAARLVSSERAEGTDMGRLFRSIGGGVDE